MSNISDMWKNINCFVKNRSPIEFITCKYLDICNGGCNSSCLVDDNLTVPNPENCEIFQGCYGYVCAKLDDLRCTTAWNTENVVVLGMLREFMSTKD